MQSQHHYKSNTDIFVKKIANFFFCIFNHNCAYEASIILFLFHFAFDVHHIIPTYVARHHVVCTNKLLSNMMNGMIKNADTPLVSEYTNTSIQYIHI